MRAPQPGDGWVDCSCGGRHWGLHGAAGLLLVRSGDGDVHVVMQHRATWSDAGGTWGIPGGALGPHEDVVGGALREAAEEAGIDPAAVEVVTTRPVHHGTWSSTTVVARATGPHEPRPTDAESIAVTWIRLQDVGGLPLHPGFALAWPALRALVESLDGDRSPNRPAT